MNKNKFSRISFLWILIAGLSLTTCKKYNNDVGIGVQPTGDKLNVFSTDTATVISYSQIVDSVKTDETSLNLFGSMMDPVFGITTASIYTQFRLSKSSHSFGTNPIADSLVLSLEYSGYYGDTNSALTIKVYEMAEQIHIDSAYYSHQSVPVKTTLLGQKTFVPDFTNKVVIGPDTLAPHLRVNLGELTTELTDRLLSIPADSMATNDSFLNYFYGLYVTVEPVSSSGIIIYYTLTSTLSRMTVYYRNDSEDSISFDYTINSNCARFGSFIHDYELGDPSFRAQVIDKDTNSGRNVCYIQAMGGVKTFLRFPYIRNFYADGKIALNEAHLFLKTYETDPELSYAKSLVMVGKTETGGFKVLEDQLEGSNYFGGNYDAKTGGYWFRITSTVQDLMRATDPDYGLEIYLSGGAINAERVLFIGTNPQAPLNPDDRLKLVITYTKLN